MKTRYINMKTGRDIETIDEFPANTKEERKELRKMLAEYRMAYGGHGDLYISQRATKDWNSKD
jgi:hypothetical protein